MISIIFRTDTVQNSNWYCSIHSLWKYIVMLFILVVYSDLVCCPLGRALRLQTVTALTNALKIQLNLSWKSFYDIPGESEKVCTFNEPWHWLHYLNLKDLIWVRQVRHWIELLYHSSSLYVFINWVIDAWTGSLVLKLYKYQPKAG